MNIKIKKNKITKKDIEETLGIKIKTYGFSSSILNIEIDDKDITENNKKQLKELNSNNENNKVSIKTMDLSTDTMQNKIEKLRKLFFEGQTEIEVKE